MSKRREVLEEKNNSRNMENALAKLTNSRHIYFFHANNKILVNSQSFFMLDERRAFYFPFKWNDIPLVIEL